MPFSLTDQWANLNMRIKTLKMMTGSLIGVCLVMSKSVLAWLDGGFIRNQLINICKITPKNQTTLCLPTNRRSSPNGRIADNVLTMLIGRILIHWPCGSSFVGSVKHSTESLLPPAAIIFPFKEAKASEPLACCIGATYCHLELTLSSVLQEHSSISTVASGLTWSSMPPTANRRPSGTHSNANAALSSFKGDNSVHLKTGRNQTVLVDKGRSLAFWT